MVFPELAGIVWMGWPMDVQLFTVPDMVSPPPESIPEPSSTDGLADAVAMMSGICRAAVLPRESVTCAVMLNAPDCKGIP